VIALIYALIAGGACWIVSELLEMAFGGRTALTLMLTAAFHLLMVGGIWAAYAGQGDRKGRLDQVAAAMASVGYLIVVYPPIAVTRDPSLDYIEFMQSSSLFWAAGMLVTLGVALFGAAVLRSRSYPATMGLALLACPLVFMAVILLDGPPLIGFAANVLLGSVFIAMGVRTLRRKP
jgi:hypothetical protein